MPDNLQSRQRKALGIIRRYGWIEGDHHKAWVIDQVFRVLAGPDYDEWVKAYCAGEEGPNTFSWDEGIAP